MSNLAERIKALRKALDESTETFAARFARSGRTVEDWEQGRRRPDPLALQIIDQIEATAAKKARKKARKKSQKNPI